MWLIAGLVLGATIGLLWVRELDPEWVQATGTWVGGVATVLTLLWAVRVFRKDQEHRESERQRRHEESLEAEHRQEQKRLEEASRVSVALRGGAAQGTRDNMKMTSLHLDLHNDSPHTAAVEEVEFDESLKRKQRIQLPIRVPPHSTENRKVEVEEVSVPKEERGGRPLKSYGARIVYTINGETWSRRSGGDPERLP